MTRTPSLIAVDIDGTLLSSTGTVLPGTRAEFARARDAGATIALVSGRPIAGLRRLVRRLRLDAQGFVFVGGNGAVSVEADTGEVLARHPLPIPLARRIAAFAAERQVTVMMCDGDDLVADRPQDEAVIFEAEGNDLAIRPVPDLAAITEGDVVADKILMTADPAHLRAFADVFEPEFGGEVETAFSAPFYFETTLRGVDKGSAIREVAAARGLSMADTVAFGDNGNDLPMIRAAGLGVAMANGIEAVRAAADRVTASHDDEGIAAVLAELFGDGHPAPPVPEPEGVEAFHALDLRESDSAATPQR